MAASVIEDGKTWVLVKKTAPVWGAVYVVIHGNSHRPKREEQCYLTTVSNNLAGSQTNKFSTMDYLKWRFLVFFSHSDIEKRMASHHPKLI